MAARVGGRGGGVDRPSEVEESKGGSGRGWDEPRSFWVEGGWRQRDQGSQSEEGLIWSRSLLRHRFDGWPGDAAALWKHLCGLLRFIICFSARHFCFFRVGINESVSTAEASECSSEPR